MSLREQIIHSLRMRGWSRIDAENYADATCERRRAAIAMEAQRGGTPKSDPTAEGGDGAGLEETRPTLIGEAA